MNEVYTIDLSNKVLRRYVSESAAQRMGNGQAIFRNAEELLDNPNVNTNLLVEVYNENTNVPVKRFSDNKTGAKRILKLCSDLHLTKTYWDSGEYNSNSVDAPKNAVSESIALLAKNLTKKVSKPRGAFAGKMIKALVTENPRKVNTKEVCGYASFNLLLKHGADMPYEEYIRQGGRLNDLKWDIDRKWAEVYNA